MAYGVDALFSAYFNRDDKRVDGLGNCLIISIGFHTVSIVPVVNGAIATDGVRRINIGGFQLTNFTCRSMQLKYPQHVNSITIGRAEEILHSHCRYTTQFHHQSSLYFSHWL